MEIFNDVNAAGTAALEARGLAKSFGGHPAVSEVGFRVGYGRIVGLLGPNGAGKTTVMRMLLGLASPDSGAALVTGRPYRELEHPARTIGAVLDASGIHPARTGRDHVRIAAAMAGFTDERAHEVLAQTGMSDAADRRISGYSLGMRQRLALAAALVGDPRILVLDEPTNGLDPAGIHWLRGWLRAFADQGGTALISSHGLAEIAQVCDEVVIVAHGRSLASGSLAELTAGFGGSLESYYLEVTASQSGVR